MQEDPGAVRRRTARRDDPADHERRVGQLALRRIGGMIFSAVRWSRRMAFSKAGSARRILEAIWHTKLSRKRAKRRERVRAAVCATPAECRASFTAARNRRSRL